MNNICRTRIEIIATDNLPKYHYSASIKTCYGDILEDYHYETASWELFEQKRKSFEQWAVSDMYVVNFIRSNGNMVCSR